MKRFQLVVIAMCGFPLGCSGPQMLTTPPQPTLVDGEGFTVEYVETPYKSSEPRLRVVEDRPDASGERPARVTVLGPNGKRLREFRNLFHRHEFAVQVPIDFKAGESYDARLTLVVDRPGEPDERMPLNLRLRRVECPTAPLENEDPSLFLGVTYPLWGFWRDLLDTPFTLLNRGGLQVERLGDNQINAANGLVMGGAAVGAALGAREGFRRGDGAFEDFFYVGAGSFVGAVGGAVVGGIVAGVWEYVVTPIETVLFRCPLDLDLIKSEAYAVQTPADQGVDLEAYDKRLRSLSYFPNWRFGVRGHSLSASDRTRPVWIVEAMGLGSGN